MIGILMENSRGYTTDKTKGNYSMENIKYTSDGMKVSILGTVNSNEFIAQEILVKNGIEILSGQNIVVKNLHDEPVETWRDMDKKRLEADIKELESKKILLQSEVSRFRKRYKDSMDTHINWIRGITNEEVKDVVSRIKSFILGEYTHIVFIGYEKRIEEYGPSTFQDNDYGTKMVSIFGSSFGNNNRFGLTYKINESNEKPFVPCKSLSEAKKVLKESIEAQGRLSDSDFAVLRKYEIPINEEMNKRRANLAIKNLEDTIESRTKDIESLKEKIMQYKKEI